MWLPLVKTKSGAARLFCSDLNIRSETNCRVSTRPDASHLPNVPTVIDISRMVKKQKRVSYKAKEKANRLAQQKAWEEAGRKGKSTTPQVVSVVAHGLVKL